MAVYIITGKLGSGKSLVSVGKAFDYLQQNRRVAANFDLYPEKLMKMNDKKVISRLPAKPRVDDLNALGLGCDELNEDMYGALLLDECGTWLNSRSWNDPERKAFIDWLIHARKFRWDVYIIVQNINVIDKQVRETLCEHLVVCKRMDRLQVPFLSRITWLLTGYKMKMPKIHRAVVYYGDSETDLKADKWTYRGKQFYQAYNTEQVFSDDSQLINGELVDMRASYSVLPRWHTEGRYHVKKPFITHPIQLLILPTWLLIKLVSALISKDTPRSVVPLRSV